MPNAIATSQSDKLPLTSKIVRHIALRNSKILSSIRMTLVPSLLTAVFTVDSNYIFTSGRYWEYERIKMWGWGRLVIIFRRWYAFFFLPFFLYSALTCIVFLSLDTILSPWGENSSLHSSEGWQYALIFFPCFLYAENQASCVCGDAPKRFSGACIGCHRTLPAPIRENTNQLHGGGGGLKFNTALSLTLFALKSVLRISWFSGFSAHKSEWVLCWLWYAL